MSTSIVAPAASSRVNARQPWEHPPPPVNVNAIDWPESWQTCAGDAAPSLQSASIAQRAPAQLVPAQLATQCLMGPIHVPSGEPAPQSVSVWHGLPMHSMPPFSVQPGRQRWLSVATPRPVFSLMMVYG